MKKNINCGPLFWVYFFADYFARWRALKEPRVASRQAVGESQWWVEDAMREGHV